MHDFHYEGRELWCEEVPVATIASEVGTPLYIYSHRTLKNHFRVFDDALPACPSHLRHQPTQHRHPPDLYPGRGGVDIVSGGAVPRPQAGRIPSGWFIPGGQEDRGDRIRPNANILMFNVSPFRNWKSSTCAQGV